MCDDELLVNSIVYQANKSGDRYAGFVRYTVCK